MRMRCSLLEERRGGGLGPISLCTKMAQPDFPAALIRFSHCGHFGPGGGGVLLVSRSDASLGPAYLHRHCDGVAHYIRPEGGPTPRPWGFPELHPLCDIMSGCCFFRGPWTVTRSSLRMLRRVAAFCRPLRPVLLPVLFLRSRSPVVGVPGLCCMWHGVLFAHQWRPVVGVLRLCWLLPGSLDCLCCPCASVHGLSITCLAVFPCDWGPGAMPLHALS